LVRILATLVGIDWKEHFASVCKEQKLQLKRIICSKLWGKRRNN